MLSERRKADREKMAQIIHALAIECGATAKIEHQPFGAMSPRMIMVNIESAGVALGLDFDGDSSQPGTFVLSWHFATHGDQRKLADAPGWSVNAYHRHKATDIVEGFEELKAVLMARLVALKDGTAFVT